MPRTRTFSGLVAPPFAYAQPEEVGLSSEKLDRLGDEIASWVASGELVGAEVLIVKEEKAIFHEAYGWSDREAREPMRRNSIFAVQSMSKPFTATAVLMLVEEGLLALDDPVGRYIPDFARDDITIHHLLSHTSGFTHDGDWYDYESPEASLRELVETWPHRTPEQPLGAYRYADFNYACLAYIVGKASGTPIDDFIRERILHPLGLDDTSTGFSSDPEWRSRLNAWYRWNDRARAFDLRRSTDWAGWSFYPGAWGILSTAMDYAAFMAMWMRHGAWRGTRLLRDETIETALQPHAEEAPSVGYGYGWQVDSGVKRMDGRAFWHGGGGGTLAIALPADDMMVVYLTQSRWGTQRSAFWNRLYMSGLVEHPGLGLAFDDMVWAAGEGVTEVALSEEERAAYVGTYAVVEPEAGGTEEVQIWEEGGLLHLRLGRTGSKADRRFHLVPLGDERFAPGRYEDGLLQAIDPSHGIRFVVDGDGARGLEILTNDRVWVSARRSP